MKILTRKKQGEIYYMLAQIRCATFGIKVNTVNEAGIVTHISKEIDKKTKEVARSIGEIDGEIEVVKLGIRIMEKELGSRYKIVEDETK